MNLNQSTHSDREFDFMVSRMQLNRKVVTCYPKDQDILQFMATWMRASALWILAGGAHHTGYSQNLSSEHIEDFANMADIEFVKIDRNTNLYSFKKELKCTESYYMFKKGF